jgi:hypothetical protein
MLSRCSTTVVLVCNTHPKEFCNLYSILSRCYSVKVETSKDCKYEIRKRKEGWEEANSSQAIYSVVLVDTTLPLVHVVEALHTRILLLDYQVSPKVNLTCHLGSATTVLGKAFGHLNFAYTKYLLHQRRGSPHPPHRANSSHHTNSKGWRCWWN